MAELTPSAVPARSRRVLPKRVVAPVAAASAFGLLAAAPAWALLGIVQALILAALGEVYRLLGVERPALPLALSVLVSLPLLTGADLLGGPALAAALLIYLAACLFRAAPEPGGLRADLVGTVFGWMYCAWLLAHLGLLLHLPQGRDALLAVVLLTTVRNVAAGRLGPYLPGHSASPFSPRKCWEHGAAALLVTGGAAAAARTVALGSIAPAHLAVLCLLVGVGGFAGDLAASMLKRVGGAAESGTALHGMGGFLDVLDGYTFTAPLAYYYLLLAAGV